MGKIAGYGSGAKLAFLWDAYGLTDRLIDCSLSAAKVSRRGRVPNIHMPLVKTVGKIT